MSWSRISRRISLLNHSKNLRILSQESRFLPDSLYSSYKFFKASSGCGNSGLMPRCEFSTKPLTRSFDFHPYGSRCLVRLSSFSSQRHYASHASHASTEWKSKKTLLYLTALVFAMVGSSYAAVPLYRRFCQATGYGGTVQRRESVEEKIAWHEKDGTCNSMLMWRMECPGNLFQLREVLNFSVVLGHCRVLLLSTIFVRVKPGESALAFYTAENQSSKPIIGVSTYNITPMKAAVYFNKIQCFCFEEQRLLPGEQIDMPVFFYLDPEFETDARMDGINNLILSYTFFKVSEE
ncbi:hypothetical protein CXB51_028349 [Gossypium anomalum]|uniref:Cytochrome c oxidase assembly protein n=1 Tax=Gossypium anomalum TaxID=47600 RepID=A0A8J5YCH6_9ROSI|nr:hypothetical protein CXB51_028349 [Gossypium anomalum]